jgi:hypothetical protein
MRRLLFAGLGRLYAHRLAREDTARRPELESFSPGILTAFDEIARVTGKTGPYVAKCWELLCLLRKHRPQFILELGSGRTTLLFAAYAKKHAVPYVAYEQDPRWLELINDLSHRLHRSRPVELAEVETAPQGGRYRRPIPERADFVYVDAPYVAGRSFPTFTGKPAYMDVPLSLAAGHKPKVIVVDGRTDTVDEILKFRAYRFTGSLDWARERGVLCHAMRMVRHSVFVATSGSAP